MVSQELLDRANKRIDELQNENKRLLEEKKKPTFMDEYDFKRHFTSLWGYNPTGEGRQVHACHIIAGKHGGPNHYDNFILLGEGYNIDTKEDFDYMNCYIAGLPKTRRAVKIALEVARNEELHHHIREGQNGRITFTNSELVRESGWAGLTGASNAGEIIANKLYQKGQDEWKAYSQLKRIVCERLRFASTTWDAVQKLRILVKTLQIDVNNPNPHWQPGQGEPTKARSVSLFGFTVGVKELKEWVLSECIAHDMSHPIDAKHLDGEQGQGEHPDANSQDEEIGAEDPTRYNRDTNSQSSNILESDPEVPSGQEATDGLVAEGQEGRQLGAIMRQWKYIRSSFGSRKSVGDTSETSRDGEAEGRNEESHDHCCDPVVTEENWTYIYCGKHGGNEVKRNRTKRVEPGERYGQKCQAVTGKGERCSFRAKAYQKSWTKGMEKMTNRVKQVFRAIEFSN